MTNQDDQDDEILTRNVEQLLPEASKQPALNDVARARMRQALISKHGTVAAPRRSYRLPAIALGLAAVAAGGFIALRGHRGIPTGSPATAGATSPLPDGTSFVARDGARVVVIGDRHLRVSGEVVLDVVPGKGPFIVDTERGTIQVLGTRFLVAADEAHTAASVIRGSVVLAANGAQVVLHAGEQGVATIAGPPQRMPAPRLSQLTSWAQETLEAADRPRGGDGPALLGTIPQLPGAAQTPLPIRELTADIVVDRGQARVALDQTFHNPGSQLLEGEYRAALPPDAALQRLAMYSNGQLMESAVVDRMTGRRVYEDIVYKRLDPALMEYAGAGKVTMRVYPLPPQQDKRIIMAYTQSLARLYDDTVLRVPLPHLDAGNEALAIKVRVRACAACELASSSHQITVTRDGDDRVVEVHGRGAQAGDAFVLDVRDPRHGVEVATAADGATSYLSIRAPVALSPTSGTAIGGKWLPPAYRKRSWVLLVDESASRSALQRRAQRDAVRAFARELDEDDTMSVLAFDTEVRQVLPPTRVLDVGDQAFASWAAPTGPGIGATDLAAALQAATAQLAGTPHDDAYIVYLGDGEITSGSRDIAALRQSIAPVARFIGLGVGDGADLPTMQYLAAGTGGYATSFALSEDLRWRVFDLVAALRTPRVVDVRAELVGGDGAVIGDATSYLRAAQLADGESIDLVAKLPAGKVATSMRLTGRLADGGAAWTDSVALPGSAVPGGFVPRLWAQRRIAALMDDKLSAGAADEAEAAREKLRLEIVALGKQYFLLSRHTSLIVLENDAMYAQYGLVQSVDHSWEPYASPKTVPVTAVATAPVGNDDQVLERIAVATSYRGGPLGDIAQLADVASAGIGLLSTARPTRFPPPWRMDVRPMASRAAAGKSDGERRPPTDSSVELAPPPPVVTKAATDLDANDDATRMSPAQHAVPASDKSAGPVAVTGSSAADRTLDEVAQVPVTPMTTTALAGDASGEGRGSFGGGLRGYAGLLGDSRWDLQSYRYVPGSWGAALTRLTSAWDVAWNDPTELVTAMVPGPTDAIAARAPIAPATTSAPATVATLFDRAHAGLPAGVYRWGQLEVAVDQAQHVAWRRIDDLGLVEVGTVTGDVVLRAYPELGIEVARSWRAADLLLTLGELPFWLGDAAAWTQRADLAATGDTLTATARTDERSVWTIHLDAAGHVATLDDPQRGRTTITWGASGPVTAARDGQPIAVGFIAAPITSATAWAETQRGLAAGVNAGAALVRVELPLHPVTVAAARATRAAGTADWLTAQRQLMASQVAVHDYVGLDRSFRALAAQHPPALGDVVLAQVALATVGTDASMRTTIGAVPELAAGWDCGGAKQPCGPPSSTMALLGRYARAARGYRPYGGNDTFAFDPGTGALATFIRYRSVMATLDHGYGGKRALARLTSIGQRVPSLDYLVASAFRWHGDVDPATMADAWRAITVGPLRNVAPYEAAVGLVQRGRNTEARLMVQGMTQTWTADALPIDDSTYFAASLFGRYNTPSSSAMVADWASWRDRVLAAGRVDHLFGLAQMQLSLAPDEVTPILSRAWELAGADPALRRRLFGVGVQLNARAWLTSRLPEMATSASDAATLRVCAQVADASGQLSLAAELSRRLVELQLAHPAPGTTVTELRSDVLGYARRVKRQVADGATIVRADGVPIALALLERWNAVSAGDAQVESAVAEIAMAANDKVQARRVLASAIDRDPFSGTGFAALASLAEGSGDRDAALTAWHEAVIVDQTNPTWRLSYASALVAAGRRDEAVQVLRDIAGRRWHERWNWQVENARQMLRELAPQPRRPQR